MFNTHTLSDWREEAACVPRMTTERNRRKKIGCSWITIKGTVHQFIVGDQHHPPTEDICPKLLELDFSDTVQEHAFASFQHQRNTPVVVFKNPRAYKDCHDFGNL